MFVMSLPLMLVLTLTQAKEIDDKIEIKSELEQTLEFALRYEEDYKDQALEFLKKHYKVLLDSQKNFCICTAKEPKYCELIRRVCFVSLDVPTLKTASNQGKIGTSTFLMSPKEKQIYDALKKALTQKGEENLPDFIVSRGLWSKPIENTVMPLASKAPFLVLGFRKNTASQTLDFEHDVRIGYEFLRKNLQYIDAQHKNAIDKEMTKKLHWGQYIDEHTHCITKNLPSFDMLLSNGVSKDSILDMPQFGDKCSGGSIMGFVNDNTFIIAQIYSQQYYYGGDYYINSAVFVNDGDMLYVFLHSNPPT